MASGTHQRDIAPPSALPEPPRLRELPRCAVLLDFDGTLVDIAPAPDAIEVAPGLPALIGALSERLEGRLAIVTGRALADLDSWLGGIPVAASGSHGSELRVAGSDRIDSLADPVPPRAEAELSRFAEARPGLLVEPKPFGVALHYRRRPEVEPEALALADELGNALGLAVKRGKMVVELIAAGVDKGTAVARLMALPQFAGAQPLFVGDDVTDEDAFAAVLQFGGGGVLVGPERETAALWRLAGVQQVHAWLSEALA